MSYDAHRAVDVLLDELVRVKKELAELKLHVAQGKRIELPEPVQDLLEKLRS